SDAFLAVRNAESELPPDLPGGGVADGDIFSLGSGKVPAIGGEELVRQGHAGFHLASASKAAASHAAVHAHHHLHAAHVVEGVRHCFSLVREIAALVAGGRVPHAKVAQKVEGGERAVREEGKLMDG